MRGRLASSLVLVLLAAGCAAPGDAPSVTVSPTMEAGTSPTEPGVGENATDELDTTPFPGTLYFAPDYTFTFEPPTSESTVPERVDPAAFYSLQAGQSATWSPWATGGDPNALEIMGDLTVDLRIRASAHATQTTPKAAGFPGAGGWIGSGEARNLFYLHQGAPERLEPDVTYSFSTTITLPRGGLLLRPGEAFSPHPWLAYQTGDGTPVQYVVGGDDPASIVGTLRRVPWPATTAVEILSETGEMGPHPGFTTAGNPDAVEFPLSLPEGTHHVVIETTGAAKAGTADIDVDVMKGGDVILGGHGPGTDERVVLGPGNIEAYGRELSIYVSSSSVAGNTWSVKATAYVVSG